MQEVTHIRRCDKAYPDRLLSLDMAPEELWAWGRWDAALPSVAIVGARAASGTGQDAAQRLSRALAEAGVAVVSGGAIGIDGAAHAGALRGEGRTCVVLGTGADVLYPSRNRPLFQKVVQAGGCLLSMFPLGTPPKPWHFPARNRVIAALSDVVVVVEAQTHSGSRSTALAGLELDRAVGAVPGSPGTDALIREGAQAVRHVDDVMALLCARAPWQGPLREGLPSLALLPLFRPLFDQVDEQAGQVRAALDRTPRDLGELSVRTGLPAATCAAAVIDLELQGLCTRLAGGRYIALECTS